MTMVDPNSVDQMPINLGDLKTLLESLQSLLSAMIEVNDKQQRQLDTHTELYNKLSSRIKDLEARLGR